MVWSDPRQWKGLLLKGTRIESQTTGPQITNQSLAENMTKWKSISLNQRFVSSYAYQEQSLLQMSSKILNHLNCTKKTQPMIFGPDSEILVEE